MSFKESFQSLFSKRQARPSPEQWDHASQPYTNDPGYLRNRDLWLDAVAKGDVRQAERDKTDIEQAKDIYTARLVSTGKTPEEAEELAAGLSLNGAGARSMIKAQRLTEERLREREIGFQLKEAERQEKQDHIDRLIAEGRLQRTPQGIRSIIRTK
jgi:hypothetical protein